MREGLFGPGFHRKRRRPATVTSPEQLEARALLTAPVAVVDAATTDENTAIAVDVLANDTDVDDGDDPSNFSLDSIDSVSVSGLTTGSTVPDGVVTISSNQVLFSPGTEFDELDVGDTATLTIAYTMSDVSGETSSSVLTLTVTGAADAPVISATDTTLDVIEGATAINTGNFSDADSDTLTLSASEGEVTDNLDGTWSWELVTTDNAASRTVTITVTDGTQQATTTFDLTVSNDNPVPTIDSVSSPQLEGTEITIEASATDAAGTSDTLTFSYEVTKDGADFASESGVNQTTFSFTPDDEASYVVELTVTDEDGGTATASQTISVSNTAPELVNLVLSASQADGQATLSGAIVDAGTLDEFTVDIDWGDPNSENNIEQVTFAAGTTTFNLTHQYSDDIPTSTASLTISDNGDGSSTSSATVVPLDGVVSGFVFYDYNDDGTMDSNESGVVGALITLTGTTAAGGDQVTRRYLTDIDGSYTFENLEAGTYQVVEEQPASTADGLDRTTATGPVGGDDIYTDIELAASSSVGGLNFGEGNIDAEFITPLWLLASSGRESFQRDTRGDIEEASGNIEFAQAIRDGETVIDSSFDLNGSPTAIGESFTVLAGQTLTTSEADGVLSNDSDPEGQALTAEVVSQPNNGSVTLNQDGSFTYRPDDGFVGTDSFSYSASDGARDSAPATVSIVVENPNTFSVVASAVVENDPVGIVEPLTSLTGDVVFSVLDTSIDEDFRLVPDDHTVGLAESPVVLIEYLDFACGACREFHEDFVDDIERDFAGDLLIVYRHLPRLDTVFAQEAAIAAEAASRQGFFDAMMDELFANQDEWRDAGSAAEANALFESYITDNIPGINIGQYRADIADPEVAARVSRDEDVADERGFLGTPAFVLNGVQQTQGIAPGDLRISIGNAVAEAERDEFFKINRFDSDSGEAGELSIFNADLFDADATPVLFDIEARTNSGSEIIQVAVDVT